MWTRACLGGLLLALTAWLLPTFTPDFGQDYAAARAWWNGADVNGRTVKLLGAASPRLSEAYAETNPAMQTAHPPSATLLALPFAQLPWPLARFAWLGIGWAAVVLGWHLGQLPPATCAATVPLWIFSLALGTHEPLLFALLAAAMKAGRSRPGWCGGLVGLATALKVYPAVFVIGLALSRQYRAAAVAVVACIAVMLVSESVLGSGATAEWAAYLPVNTLRYVDDARNVSLVRPLRLLVPGMSPIAAAAGLALLLAAPLLRRLYQSDGISPLLPVVLLASPLVWRYYVHLICLIPLYRRELWLLTVPPILLLLGLVGVPPASGLPGFIERSLVVLVQLPLMVVLLLVWYRQIGVARGEEARTAVNSGAPTTTATSARAEQAATTAQTRNAPPHTGLEPRASRGYDGRDS